MSFLSSIYTQGQTPQFELTIKQLDSTPVDAIVSGSTIPDVHSALTSLNNDMYYSIYIKATSTKDLSPVEIENQISIISKIIDFINTKKVSFPSFRYAINITSDDTGYLCDLSQEELYDGSLIAECLKKSNGKIW